MYHNFGLEFYERPCFAWSAFVLQNTFVCLVSSPSSQERREPHLMLLRIRLMLLSATLLLTKFIQDQFFDLL